MGIGRGGRGGRDRHHRAGPADRVRRDIATRSYSDSADVERSFSSVRFANDAGDVTIRTGDTASVRREVHHGDEKPEADTFRVRDGVLELDPCGRRDCWIDYEVTVPAGTTVTGQLDSGTADLSGVAAVTVRASSGEVTVNDVAGDVVVQLTEPRDVRVDADSGDVELTVPPAAYRVVTSTDSGNIDSEVDDDSSGEHRLDLHTDSGNITVTQA